jgi:hypothetical protein
MSFPNVFTDKPIAVQYFDFLTKKIEETKAKLA